MKMQYLPSEILFYVKCQHRNSKYIYDLLLKDFSQQTLIYFFVAVSGSTRGISCLSKESTGMMKACWEPELTSAIKTIQLNSHWTMLETATEGSITVGWTLNKLLQGTLKLT